MAAGSRRSAIDGRRKPAVGDIERGRAQHPQRLEDRAGQHEQQQQRNQRDPTNNGDFAERGGMRVAGRSDDEDPAQHERQPKRDDRERDQLGAQSPVLRLPASRTRHWRSCAHTADRQVHDGRRRRRAGGAGRDELAAADGYAVASQQALAEAFRRHFVHGGPLSVLYGRYHLPLSCSAHFCRARAKTVLAKDAYVYGLATPSAVWAQYGAIR
jgi:hypothetical protein